MPAMEMEHEIDPAAVLREKLGDISSIELFNNQVLVAIYVRPEKTKGGIIITDTARDEDKSQGKIGLVIKQGPNAFVDPTGAWFNGEKLEEDEWIFFRASDGWALSVNKIPCRILDDTNVRGRVQNPDSVW